MKKRTISYSQLAIEFVSVVFAVLLALGLNAYKQSLDAENDAEILKKSIILECKNNKAKVDSVLIKNEQFANYLDSLVSLDIEDVDGVSFYYDFQLLTNSAWDIAQNNTAINILEQDFLIQAADIYQTQKFYSDFATQFFGKIAEYAMMQDDVKPYNTALSIYYSINTMNSSAYDLLEQYDAFLNTYDTSPK